MLLIIAMVGTTVAPWQLFFSAVEPHRQAHHPRWINYEGVDTWLGAGRNHGGSSEGKEQWTMAPLALLGRPEMSTDAEPLMLTMSGYLVVAVIVLLVEAAQLAGG